MKTDIGVDVKRKAYLWSRKDLRRINRIYQSNYRIHGMKQQEIVRKYILEDVTI